MNDFFSVCIPATGREKTITRCLESLCKQDYFKFEVIITAREGANNIAQIIKGFKNSHIYKKSKFKLDFYEINKESSYCDDWNDPIGYAKGDFIAMLEGDDYFEHNHLSNALRHLNDPKVVLYATGHQLRSRELEGGIRAKNFRRSILRMKDVPTPSEVIFRRLIMGQPVYYDTHNYKYAPEIDLYLRLSLIDDFTFYISRINSVWRDPLDKPMKMKLPEHFNDHLRIMSIYKNHYNKLDYLVTYLERGFKTATGCELNIKANSEFYNEVSLKHNLVTKLLLLIRIANTFFFKIRLYK